MKGGYVILSSVISFHGCCRLLLSISKDSSLSAMSMILPDCRLLADVTTLTAFVVFV